MLGVSGDGAGGGEDGLLMPLAQPPQLEPLEFLPFLPLSFVEEYEEDLRNRPRPKPIQEEGLLLPTPLH